jgi:hypothetical protein
MPTPPSGRRRKAYGQLSGRCIPVCFMVSADTQRRLIELAAQHKISRTALLERLIMQPGIVPGIVQTGESR